MDYSTFVRIVTAFADSPSDIDHKRGELIAQVRDDVLHVKLVKSADGGLVCEDGGVQYPAARWIVERLGRAPTLARRILEHIPDDPLRIGVAADVVDVLERAPSEQSRPVQDAMSEAQSLLARAGGFETTVLYVTSDAGEGKTNLLNALARAQAQAYLDKKSDWLLLPVALGGRPFIRLDDVIVGSLANKLRFPFYYFEAVIELVRLGAIVLALDGFEEMFVETAAGDAISSLGGLVSRMKSEGRIVIAARTAYFRYKGLDTQAKLFQGLAEGEVAFAELRLHRWSKADFLKLCVRAGVPGGEVLYETIAAALGIEHPLLTRAVLARALIHEYGLTEDKPGLLARLTSATGEGYFAEFVSALLDREVQTKWIDRSGEAAKPLLSRDEHHVLLSFVADEMWRSGVESLSGGLLEVICDMVVADLLKKPVVIHRQARERIKQHALLSDEAAPGKLFSFDHEDFKNFYLGRRVGDLLAEMRADDLRALLGVGPMPALAQRVAVSRASALNADWHAVIVVLCSIAKAEPAVSYTRQNCAYLALKGVDGKATAGGWTLRHLYFGVDAFSGIALKDIRFEDCIILRTSLARSGWRGVEFERCSLERLDLPEGWHADGVRFDVPSVPQSLVVFGATEADEEMVFEPALVRRVLAERGAVVAEGPVLGGAASNEVQSGESEQLRLALRAVRVFRRSTAVNEGTMRSKMGEAANEFFADVLPELLRAGVLLEVPYHGAGVQRRFRLNRDFARVERARVESGGDFRGFVDLLRTE